LPTFKFPTFDFEKIFGTALKQNNPPVVATNTVKNTQSAHMKIIQSCLVLGLALLIVKTPKAF
jgi:hypothetical protein